MDREGEEEEEEEEDGEEEEKEEEEGEAEGDEETVAIRSQIISVLWLDQKTSYSWTTAKLDWKRAMKKAESKLCCTAT